MATRGLATFQEAAKYLSVSTRTIYRMIDDGELDRVDVRGRGRVRWSQLERIAQPKKKRRKRQAATSGSGA